MSVKSKKLFGTCRLCLEVEGPYRISPKVQEQIKYCFDINVNPLDGLPQWLCNVCRRILNDFVKTKKQFVAKQNDYINKTAIKTTDNHHSDKPIVPKYDDSNSDSLQSTAVKRKQIVLSFPCSRPEQQSQCMVSQIKKDEKKPVSWRSEYTKEFVCRLCNYHSKKRTSIFKHTSSCHKNLKMKYKNIFKNRCQIKLDKYDKLPNVTGLNDIVVISTEKIIQGINTNYYAVYTPKDFERIVEKKCKIDIPSDDNIERKKPRISSDILKSETENQEGFINLNKERKEIIDGDCINIDDSSDSASENYSNKKQGEPFSNSAVISQQIIPVDTSLDYLAKIENIISMCQNKYKKNIDLHKMHDKQPNDLALSKSQLKHKVLSIGRKIINKQGFNCTGLLRYMEHRNLEIVWTPNMANYNSDTNYVRIMTKLRANMINEDDSGWKTCDLKSKPTVDSNSVDIVMPKICQVFYNDGNIPWTGETKSKILNENPVANPKKMPKKTVVIGKQNDLLIPIQNDCSNLNELSQPKKDSAYCKPNLNPLPPLPSQLNSVEQNINDIAHKENHTTHKKSDTEHQGSDTEQKENNTDHKENAIEHKENDTTPPQNVDKDTEVSTGRIKVKPLAELLSKEGLINTFANENSTSCNILYQDKKLNMYSTTIAAQSSHPNQIMLSNARGANYKAITTIQSVYPSLVVHSKEINKAGTSGKSNQSTPATQQEFIHTQPRLAPKPQLTSETPSLTEYVIMDTVELPSTKTNSPIQYLENLLLIHNIYLLDHTKHELSQSFVCLIRFKVLYKQDTMKEPILLSLSLYSNKNEFCMKVKNMQQENIDISKISANWQWEIIKVFKGDVTNKLLQNAQKVNQETYEYAKTFLFLLKTINYTKV